MEYSETTPSSCSFDRMTLKNTILFFLSNNNPYLKLKEFDIILSALNGLSRSEVISLFASISSELFTNNISVKKLYKLSTAWLYCTNTSQIKRYPNMANESLLIWSFTGLFHNIDVVYKYLRYLLRKQVIGLGTISKFYKKLSYKYNEYLTVTDLINMVPKIQIHSNCDSIICSLINLFSNIFKHYNSFVYNKTRDFSDLYNELSLRLQSERCLCWNKLIIPLININKSMKSDLAHFFHKLGIKHGDSIYYNNLIPATTYNISELHLVNIKDIKKLIRHTKDWRILITESNNEVIEGQLNDISLARDVLFTLQKYDIFDKDDLIAIAIWALSLVSGHYIVRSTATKMVVSIHQLPNPVSEIALDLLIYDLLLQMLHAINDKLHLISHKGLLLSYIAFLLDGLSHYSQLIEHSDAELVGELLLRFIPSINKNGECIYSQHSNLASVELLVKSALKIAPAQYILESSLKFVQVRPTDLLKDEIHLQRMAYYMFIYSNMFMTSTSKMFKVFTSYLVKWTTLLSRFNEFTIDQIRLMSAILFNVLSLILTKCPKKMESIVSLLNVIFTAFTSNPALDSMWNKRGRRNEFTGLMDEITRFLALTYLIYPTKMSIDKSICYCTRRTIKSFINRFIKLLPMEDRRLPKFTLLMDVLEDDDIYENDNVDLAYNGDKRRRYNFHFKPGDDFIDFETDKNLGMLLIDDMNGSIEVRPEWKCLIGSILD